MWPLTFFYIIKKKTLNEYVQFKNSREKSRNIIINYEK